MTTHKTRLVENLFFFFPGCEWIIFTFAYRRRSLFLSFCIIINGKRGLMMPTFVQVTSQPDNCGSACTRRAFLCPSFSMVHLSPSGLLLIVKSINQLLQTLKKKKKKKYRNLRYTNRASENKKWYGQHNDLTPAVASHAQNQSFSWNYPKIRLVECAPIECWPFFVWPNSASVRVIGLVRQFVRRPSSKSSIYLLGGLFAVTSAFEPHPSVPSSCGITRQKSTAS